MTNPEDYYHLLDPAFINHLRGLSSRPATNHPAHCYLGQFDPNLSSYPLVSELSQQSKRARQSNVTPNETRTPKQFVDGEVKLTRGTKFYIDSKTWILEQDMTTILNPGTIIKVRDEEYCVGATWLATAVPKFTIQKGTVIRRTGHPPVVVQENFTAIFMLTESISLMTDTTCQPFKRNLPNDTTGGYIKLPANTLAKVVDYPAASSQARHSRYDPTPVLHSPHSVVTSGSNATGNQTSGN